MQDIKFASVRYLAHWEGKPRLAEEAPHAFQDVDRVITAVCDAGIGKKVARLRPVAVVKG